MCLNAHHQLKTVNIYSVKKQDDTGTHNLDDIIKGVTTDIYYDVSALIPIYTAYNAIVLTKGCSAWQLR